MPRRLAQQRMSMSGIEWPFYASRGISAVAAATTRIMMLTTTTIHMLIDGAVAVLVGQRTCDLQVVGSSPGWA